MKKRTLIILGVLMMTSGIATASDGDYYPLVRDGVKWYYLRFLSHQWATSSDFLYSYNFDGDTIVEDKGEMKQYKKVLYKEYDSLKNVICSGMARGMREESKVVYVKDLYENKSDLPVYLRYKPLLDYPYWYGWDEENSQFYNWNYHYEEKIYDFNRETFLADDHGLISRFRKHYYPTTVIVNEEIHNAYVVDDGIPAYTATVIEGIGVDSKVGQLLAPQYVVDGFKDALAWVEDNGVIIYRGVMYDRAMEYLTSTDITTVTGDVDCDGVVTSGDVTCIYNYLLNGTTTYIDTCDVNGDGVITSADITEIYNILLGE